jgi:cobalt-zinc-cadmium efflux system membrane fusion protein
MTNFIKIASRTMMIVAAAIALTAAGGCGRDYAQDEAHMEEHAGEVAEEYATESSSGHAGHDHGEEHDHSVDIPIEQIESARCEHGMPTYLCDECRYEIGLVKVSPDLLKEGLAGGTGLLVTDTASVRPLLRGLSFTGEIRLNENKAVHVSPPIPGIIERVYVDIGASVARGDLLMRINSVELGKTLAAYELNRSLTELSRKNYEREKLLKKQNISSEQDLIESQMDYETHRTELEAAEEALRVFGLTDRDLEELGNNKGNGGSGSLPIRASIDGTVIHRHAVIGELVEPGKDVFLLADLSTVWLWADIYEKDLSRLVTAQQKGPIPVRVHVAAFPDRAFDGSIDYIGATMDERTRTIKVRATVKNSQGQLRPGMFCELQAGLDGDERVLSVPKTALLSDEGNEFVFALWKDDFFVRRAVRTGREFFTFVEVLDGLRPGDRIVTEGAFLLKSDVLREKMGAGCAD